MTELSFLEMARFARDQGIERSACSAGSAWCMEVKEILREYLEAQPVLCTHHLWDYGLPHTHQKRALGTVIKGAVIDGWITPFKYDGAIVLPPIFAGFRCTVAIISDKNQMGLKQIWKSELYTGDTQVVGDDAWDAFERSEERIGLVD